MSMVLLVGLAGCATGVSAGDDEGAATTGGATTGATTGSGGGTSDGVGTSASTTGGTGGMGAGGSTGGTGAGGMGLGGAGAGGGGDATAPTVSSVSPADGATAVAGLPTIEVTFSEPMNPATVTAGSTTCSGTIQLSKDGFTTCVPLSTPTTTDDTTFVVVPTVTLGSVETYSLRVTGAEDAGGLPMTAPYDTPNGLTTRYAHTIVIDGTNDFLPSETIAASTPGGQLHVSYDDTHLYLGLTHPDIVVGGTGNKFVYFVLSGDLTLTTGNALSSDGKAKFGAGGTSKLNYHWKERIDGPAYTEWRIGNAVDWSTDWGTTGKSRARSAGFVEASIALSQLANPTTIVVTAFTIDYAGANGDGWLYNMVNGAADGAAATPRSTHGYFAIPVPTSSLPTDPALQLTF